MSTRNHRMIFKCRLMDRVWTAVQSAGQEERISRHDGIGKALGRHTLRFGDGENDKQGFSGPEDLSLDIKGQDVGCVVNGIALGKIYPAYDLPNSLLGYCLHRR